MDLEKDGTVDTAWGSVRLRPAVSAASGARGIPEIIDGLFEDRVEAGDVPALPEYLRIATKAVTDLGRVLLKNSGGPTDEKYPFLLLAERPAYGFHGVFSNATHALLMTREDAKRLAIETGDRVKLGTRLGTRHEMDVAVSDRVPVGVLLVNDSQPAVRALFAREVDKLAGIVTVPPAWVKVWRSE
jgi:anaerobic selenocysteine-containing dehydrogenase